MNILFDKNKANLVTSPTGTGLNYRQKPSTDSTIMTTGAKGKSKGRTTGNYYKIGDYIWYQVLLNQINKIAYVRNDVTKLTKPTSETITDQQAQKIIDELVKSDELVFESLLRSNKLIDKATIKNINVSNYKTQLETLTARLKRRQDKIKNSGLIKFKIGLKKKYEALSNNFKKSWEYSKTVEMPIMIGSGTGVGIIIGAVIAGGVSALIFFSFHPEYSESKTDLKISSDLENLLSKADPVTAKKITDNLEIQVDTAYKSGFFRGSFSGISKIVLLAALSYLGYKVAGNLKNGKQ